MEIERRTNTVELRVDATGVGAGKKPVMKGYGAKFRTLSESMPIMRDGEKVGTFREQLMPGCFASAIPVSDVRSLFNHDPNLILGRTTSGTLRIHEDDLGLAWEVDPPDTTYARNLQVSMGRGDITQCSFAFQVAEGGDTYARDSTIQDGWIRSIHKMQQIYDVSPVTYPAYLDTNCAVATRSIVGMIESENAEIEKRTAEQAELEKRTAEETAIADAAKLEEEQRAAAELAEQEENKRVEEEQRSLQIVSENEKLRLELLELY